MAQYAGENTALAITLQQLHGLMIRLEYGILCLLNVIYWAVLMAGLLC